MAPSPARDGACSQGVRRDQQVQVRQYRPFFELPTDSKRLPLIVIYRPAEPDHQASSPAQRPAAPAATHMQAIQALAGWLRGTSPGGRWMMVGECLTNQGEWFPTTDVRLIKCRGPCRAGLQASNAAAEGAAAAGAAGTALGKRKKGDEADEEEQAATAAGAAATAASLAKELADGRGGKRVATGAGPSQPAVASGSGQPPRAAATPRTQQAAAGAKRKQAGDGEFEAAAADARSPAALPRAAVRPRWEQPGAAAVTAAAAGGTSSSIGGAAIGSPAPSPYRLLSPAKAGAAPLNQLPGYHFSKTRRSSAASDVSTAGSSGGGGGDGATASGSSLQPPYRRKLAAPPSRLGGEPSCLLPMLPCCCQTRPT
jgi:hypothetical protein